MSQVMVGVVDYGVGNHASVVHSLRDMGYRVRISADPQVLDASDVLILPGVGAFPTAMQALHEHGLVSYLQQQARDQQPIIGICLGMQLLASFSHEIQYTAGLDIIPGTIVPLEEEKWHIGWNTLESLGAESLFQASDGESFYFNHSFCYQGPAEYHATVSRHGQSFVSAIRRGNVIGVQFHPEKSQTSGRKLLSNLISGVTNA
jgi:imidazole glycerol-phosphate synthase subunit HisH